MSTPTRRRLPPLNALRAFEAAGRHLSFTNAADELAVTQAAVSHQVKALEEWFGQPLFRRRNRQVFLTEMGQAYLPAVTTALDGLDEATRRLMRKDDAGRLTVSALASFATTWLVGRLGHFRDRHPNIDVHLNVDDRLADFDREDVDAAIRYGAGGWPNLKVIKFLTEEMFPVCSPALLNGPKPLREPADLQRHTLLHDDMRVDWRMWFMAAGLEGIDATRGPGYNSSALVIQAAIGGQGIALGRSPLVQADLAAGRLVKPFDLTLPSEYAFYLVYPETSATLPKIAAFTEWLLEVASER
ncbi:MAG: transcriptional regulator GcvA [Alphaproteobacteria bacterium]